MRRTVLWALMVAAACAGCAGRPVTDGGVLVSKINRERAARLDCGPSAVRYCEIDLTDKPCTCIDHQEIYRPR